MAYFTRALPYPSGFYRALHNCSTADVNLDVHAKPTISSLSAQDLDDPDVYEVERLVESRRAKVCRSSPRTLAYKLDQL